MWLARSRLANLRRGVLMGRRGLIVGAVAGISLMAAPPSWAAKPLNGFVGGLAGIGSGGLFTQVRDIAFFTGLDADRSNDKILVLEGFSGNARVQRLDFDGNAELVWGGDVIAEGAPGDTGTGFEVCDIAVSGVDGCKHGEPGAAAGLFDDPMGVAVDQGSGHVFVLDRDNLRVQEFDLAGGFVRAWGWGVDTGANAFEVCTASCQAGIAGAGVGQLGATSVLGSGIAVDPVGGDVFVADAGNRRVLRFNANGTPDGGEPVFGSPAVFSSGHPRRVAVDAAGIVYASDTTGGANRVVRYSTGSSSFLGALDVPLLTAGQTWGLEVDPDTGRLLVGRQSSGAASPLVVELSDPGAPLAPGGPPNPAVFDTHVFDTESPVNPIVPTALGYDPGNGNIYLSPLGLFVPPIGIFTGCTKVVSSGVDVCDGLIVLADGGGSLGAVVDAPTIVGADSASVSGSVDAGGGVARYVFEVSPDGSSWVGGSAVRYRSGSGSGLVEGLVSGLEPNTFYRLRLRVFKQVGMDEIDEVVSGEQIFLTDAIPPLVRTLGSARRRAHSVRLRAVVDPQGAPTSYRFEWGPAGGAFDRRVPVPDGSAGSGNTEQVLVADLDGLVAQSAYHYRIVASNFAGTSVGETVEFSTTAEPGAPGAAPERAFELVTGEAKLGGQGVGKWYEGPGTHALAGTAAYEGGRFAARGELGAVLSDGAYAFASDWALVERTAAGWVARPAITQQAFGRQILRMLVLGSATEDLSMTSWNSNGGLLRLWEEMATWNETQVDGSVALRDWEGNWEPVGPTASDQGYTSDFALASQHVLDDGSGVVGHSALRGLAGVGDPSFDGVDESRNVVRDDVSGGLSNLFPGSGVREVLSVCSAGTVIPDRLGSGKLGGRGCPATGERQAVSVQAAGGTFTLGFDGQVSGPIAFDAPTVGAGSVQEALLALSNLDPGEVEVIAGGPEDEKGIDPYLVRFSPALGDVPQLLVDGALLTGTGASASVSAVSAAPALVDSRGAAVGRDADRTLDSIVSEDGRRTFFMAPDPHLPSNSFACAGTGVSTTCPPQLFVRQENEDGSFTTRWIGRSEVLNQDASLLAPASFEGASADGDKVFLRTAAPLTEDDPNGTGAPVPGGVTTGTAHPSSVDLYMYDFPDSPGADIGSGDLTRISGGPNGDADPNVVSTVAGASGALRFMSSDGGRVYFASAAPLDGVPTPGSGTITDPGGTRTSTDASNLWVWDPALPAGQRWRFVARVPRSSELGACATTSSARGPAITDTAFEGNLLTAPGNCWRGTTDGGFVTFWTDGKLTLDDPDSVSGDVYGYDADADELVRLSEPQGGVGGSYDCFTGTSDVQCHGDMGVGPPGAVLPALGVVTDPEVAGDRVAFFESASRLVPADVDGTYDVYEWRNGVLSLITPGDHDDPDGSMYQGNDRTGETVFFSTRDRLTWQDRDDVLDVYAARVGGGIPEPPPPPDCDALAGSCQGPGAGELPSVDDPVPSQGNPPATDPVRLRATVSARAAKRAASHGVLAIGLRSSAGGLVRVTVKARLAAGRMREVGEVSKQLSGPGRSLVRVRLARALRAALADGQRVRVVVVARIAGAAAVRKAVALEDGSATVGGTRGRGRNGR